MKTDKMKKAYILVSPGFEILEAAAPVDVLERCSIEVEKVAVCGEMDGKIYGKTDLLIPSSHNVFIKADSFLSDMADVERIASDGAMVILPGGFPGYRNLSSNPLVGKLLQEYEKRGRLIAAICGAPSALSTFHILEGSKLTCHSSVKDILTAEKGGIPGYVYTGRPAEKDGRLITGRGAGVCMEFAFACAEALVSQEVIADVKRKMEMTLQQP